MKYDRIYSFDDGYDDSCHERCRNTFFLIKTALSSLDTKLETETGQRKDADKELHDLLVKVNPTVEANPSSEATETLSKLKVGDKTYDVASQRGLTLTGNHITENEGIVIGSLNITDEEYNAVINESIDYVRATGGRDEDIWGWYVGNKDGFAKFIGIECISGTPNAIRYFQLIFSNNLVGELGSRAIYTIQDFSSLPDYPTELSKDYNKLTNKPSINSVELKDNKTFEDLGLVALSDMDILSILN